MKTVTGAGILIFAASLLVLGACSPGGSDDGPIDSAELRDLFTADQSARSADNEDPTGPGDLERRRQVFELLAAGGMQTPADKFHAAMILNHTHLKFCGDEVVSASPENAYLAYRLARESLDAGFEPARLLVAQTLDRHSYYTTGKQKYGTHRVVDPKAGSFNLAPVDSTVTDAERAEYGIPPLADLLGR
ncbi:MAG: hypothetical protein GY838_19655 [bacterium]|nr:hypothetical protein [bacterium]